MYPHMSSKHRENAIAKEHKTVFIMQIGDKLSCGEPHDTRAPDYDDWSMNGDILFWNELLDCAVEISSMGIRVDKASLKRQLKLAGQQAREKLFFHQALLKGELPLTMGGGIGQSRLCMLFLQKAHIGEIQCSIWPNAMIAKCREHHIPLL